MREVLVSIPKEPMQEPATFASLLCLLGQFACCIKQKSWKKKGPKSTPCKLRPGPSAEMCRGFFIFFHIGGFCRGFSWRIFLGNFPTKMREKNPAAGSSCFYLVRLRCLDNKADATAHQYLKDLREVMGDGAVKISCHEEFPRDDVLDQNVIMASDVDSTRSRVLSLILDSRAPMEPLKRVQFTRHIVRDLATSELVRTKILPTTSFPCSCGLARVLKLAGCSLLTEVVGGWMLLRLNSQLGCISRSRRQYSFSREVPVSTRECSSQSSRVLLEEDKICK